MSIGERTLSKIIMKKIVKMISCVVFIAFIIIATILLIRAFDARKLPALKLWHQAILENEFQTNQAFPDTSFEEYLQREDALFNELNAKVYQHTQPEDRLPYNRYYTESFSHPENFSRNWNRSFELIPETISGGVLMLHGLTDSPYSNHALAQVLYEHEYYVLGLRFPGHGTVPAALTQTSWKDWQAAANIAIKHLRDNIGEQAPLYIFGYSTGGTLALKMAFDAIQNQELEIPQKVFLFSPAIAVSPFGFFADWHKLLTFLPFFEKFQWTALNPEYDPFKYNSFSKHGGGQVYQLCKEVQEQLDQLEKHGKMAALPPIITFQSFVDSTIEESALVDKLYNQLEPNQSELIIFDVNHYIHVAPFIKEQYTSLVTQIENIEPLPYAITIITNIDNQTQEVVAKTKAANAHTFEPDVPLGLFWPEQVYSLSHVALLFPPDDPLYGRLDTGAFPKSFKIGTLIPKGETSILNVSMDQLMRVRSNPFFDYLAQRVIAEIGE